MARINSDTRNPFRILYTAAVNTEGNARTCIILEPLFAIPSTLCTGYMTLYMIALGVSKSQVGMITSLGLAVNIIFALMSTYIIDRFGRRYTTMIAGIIGWGIALLLWMSAQNIYFFIAAAVINAFNQVVTVSFQCLMLEDTPPEVRIFTFNFLQISSIMAGFFTPIGAVLIRRFTLIPAMRILLLFAFISIMAQHIIRFFYTTETAVGRQKMIEMKGVHILAVFKTYVPTLLRLVKDRLLVISVLLRALNFIQLTIRNTFLAVLVTERYGFPAETMAVFHTLNAVVMLLVLLFVTPLLSLYTRRWPISLGLGFHIAATIVLLATPPGQSYVLLVLCAILIALGTAIATPRIDALMANTILNEDRSMVNAIVSVVLLLISTPFGYISGVLSEIDPRLPFLLTLMIFLLCLVLLRYAMLYERRRGFMGST